MAPRSRTLGWLVGTLVAVGLLSSAPAAETTDRRLRVETLSPTDIDDAPSFSELGRNPSWGSRASFLGNISSSAAFDQP